MDDANALLTDLHTKVEEGDVDGGTKTLSRLKIAMLQFPRPLSEEHTLLSIKSLELGVLLSVAAADVDAFCRNIAQLQPYYYYNNNTTPSTTTRKCLMLGLNLMCLLVENRLSEFHAQLELLSPAEASDPHVTFPITLERQLMVGSYDDVLHHATAQFELPHASYQFFLDSLLHTVRDSIADCLEVAYHKIQINEAVEWMKYRNEAELREYIQECRDDWIVDGQEICFQPPPTGRKASDVPSMTLIQQSLTYATELERIV